MIAIAAVALALGAAAWVLRSRHLVAGYQKTSQIHRILGETSEVFGELLSQGRTRDEEGRRNREIAYHEAMAEKYEWAARHPWLPLWPDPPEPE